MRFLHLHHRNLSSYQKSKIESFDSSTCSNYYLIESLNWSGEVIYENYYDRWTSKKIDAGEQVNIIDVREQEEVDAGIIPGAKHIALGQVETSLDQIDPSVPHYIICKAGGRSAMACEILEENGYDVTNVTGGMMAWDGEVQF